MTINKTENNTYNITGAVLVSNAVKPPSEGYYFCIPNMQRPACVAYYNKSTNNWSANCSGWPYEPIEHDSIFAWAKRP